MLTAFFLLDVILFKYFQTGFLGVGMYSKYRLSSFFNDELIMGSFFLRLLIIVNPLFLILNKEKNFFYLLIFNIISIILIIGSGERASLFLCIIYLVLNFFILNFDLKKKIILIISLLTVIFSTLIYSEVLHERFIIQPFVKENFLQNRI